MTKALGPRAGLGSDTLVPFGVLVACWVPVVFVGVVWVAGHLASWLTGTGWTGPAFGFDFGLALFRPGGVSQLWPAVAPWSVWTLTGVLLAVAFTPPGILAVRRGRRDHVPGDPLPSLASAHDVAMLTPKAAEKRALALRPSLKTPERGQRLLAQEVGVGVGQLRTPRGKGPELRTSWEDVLLAIMAPRAGKTTALGVPAILDAPGPVIATSNKADLWATTHAVRAADTDARVWVFDPQGIAGVRQTWWWNPLAGINTVEDAHRLAGHFVQEVRGERSTRDFWTSAAHDLLTGLILAAALSGRGLDEVYEWLNDPVLVTPAQVLREHGQPAAAASLTGRQNGAVETREGVYETARTAAQCLRDPQIMAWVTRPSSGAKTEFDANTFPATRQTLYLLSKDGAGAAAPLVAGLTDRVMREAVRTAERRGGGRLDPPMVVVLDEAANVCRISDLPDLYSHLGSRGVIPLTILQSYRQGTRVWGDAGMDTLWSAATCKILGAGLDDAKFVEDISRLVGEHDVTVRSVSRGSGRASESISLRRQRILPPEVIRALPRGTALLLATGCKAALVKPQPWYEGPRQGEITLGL